jgi:hypothetical protein
LGKTFYRLFFYFFKVPGNGSFQIREDLHDIVQPQNVKDIPDLGVQPKKYQVYLLLFESMQMGEEHPQTRRRNITDCRTIYPDLPGVFIDYPYQFLVNQNSITGIQFAG